MLNKFVKICVLSILWTLLFFISHAHAQSCESLFLAETLTQSDLENMTLNWRRNSKEILYAKLRELYLNSQSLEWLQNYKGQSNPHDPISEKAMQKVLSLLKDRPTEEKADPSGLFDMPERTKRNPNYLPDSPLAPALAHIHMRRKNSAVQEKHKKDFLIHAFQYMQKSPIPEIREKALNGILDHDSMVELLKRRILARKINYTIINEGVVFYFNRYIKQGIPIEWGFQFQRPINYLTAKHPVYVHLWQADLDSDLLEHYSRLLMSTPQIFLDFWSTSTGNLDWVSSWDGRGITGAGGATDPFGLAHELEAIGLRTKLELQVRDAFFQGQDLSPTPFRPSPP